MHLYDLPLQSPSSINAAVLGNFSGTKAQEVVVSRGSSTLELMRPDYETGKMVSVMSHDVFGVIRSAVAFRMLGSSKGKIRMAFIGCRGLIFW